MSGFNWLRIDPVVGCCEHGNEPEEEDCPTELISALIS
jgi:hypothetical protein